MRRMYRTQKGLSLIEVVMSMAAFTIILTGTIQITAQGAKNFRTMKSFQANLETVQFALNTMAKEFRTSSVVGRSVGDASSTITFFEYSQSRCIQYRADESTGRVEKRSHLFNATDPDVNRTSCQGYAFGGEAYQTVLTGLSAQAFNVDPSSPMPNPHTGRITVSLTVGTGGVGATAQTSVSLRDFNYIGI